MGDNENIFECIKEFLVDECDDDGNEIEEEFRTIKKGSRWEVESVTNGWVKLCEVSDETIYSWLEVSIEHLTAQFKGVK